MPAYPARETRKAYSVSRVWTNAGGLDVTRALLGRQRAEATALPNWVKPQLTKLVGGRALKFTYVEANTVYFSLIPKTHLPISKYT